eukprot:TRINITY_DN25666_c0_g1_i1.p1 TRINITY_DN25666_c0_g1~~TRINITY_DN25666_c0_g1_i1.p1  ORF type:complete len:677 (-),score=170.75 TRINITY_DN25666_c0_g1_i1:72-2102(-)
MFARSASTRGQYRDAASPRRTSTRAAHRSRCAERRPAGGNGASGDDWCEEEPVHLVVFDFDETLTLMTYKIEDDDSPEMRREIVKVNFETPWVKGCRVDKLRTMLRDLAGLDSPSPRALAVLTRNSAGAQAVLTLLQEAGLESCFRAVWTMPWRATACNGLYREASGEWKQFDPPVNLVADHKADVLNHIPTNPSAWFPQLHSCDEEDLKGLWQLKSQNIVLVDDQRANFQSASGAQVRRYCKVARYDAVYRNLGHVKNMGGLGAHCDEDYNTLRMFVEAPSMCQETLQCHCVERAFDGNDLRTPVALVVFDFDETLTLATFMPETQAIQDSLAWRPAEGLCRSEWSEQDLVTYNYESPYVSDGARLPKLRALLEELTAPIGTGDDDDDLNGGGQRPRRTLAVLSRNDSGAVAVLNLLRMGGLADYFSAIWTMPYSPLRPCGAYRTGGEGEACQWHIFEPPLLEALDHKADVLNHVTAHTDKWFPQLSSEADSAERTRRRGLLELRPESVVLVDDERANFQSSLGSEVAVRRYCKVARYDEEYRCCGPLNQMGGLGAHSSGDFSMLKAFVEQPWMYSQQVPESPGAAEGAGGEAEMPKLQADRRSAFTSEELRKLPRSRLTKSLSWSSLGASRPREAPGYKRSNSFCASPCDKEKKKLDGTSNKTGSQFSLSWVEG